MPKMLPPEEREPLLLKRTIRKHHLLRPLLLERLLRVARVAQVSLQLTKAICHFLAPGSNHWFFSLTIELSRCHLKT